MRCFRLGRPQLVWGGFIAMSFVACSVIELPPAAPQEGTAQPTILEETGDDSLASGVERKDTIYHHSEVIVYRDTIERVNEIHGTSFLSFVYRKNSGALDTVTRDSNALKCDMGEESFSCEYFAQYIVEDPIYGPPLIIYKDSIRPLDTTKVHIYVVDTVYKDTFYRNTYKRINDTTFINYGESRMTDYIPPEKTYDLGEHPFDSTAIRDFFDTLDVSDSLLGGKNHLEVNSNLKFIGFPLPESLNPGLVTLVILEPKNLEYRTWPTTLKAPKRNYVFSNEFVEFESDTTVTWTLEYTHYENGVEEADSIQVTTCFKTGQTARSASED